MGFLKYSIAMVTLLGYIFLAVLGLLSMPTMHHHASSMTTCPFMIGEQSLCTMSVTEHIDAWQSLVSVSLSKIVAIALPLLFVLLFLSLRPPNRSRGRLYERPLRDQFMTQLFARGILHSKAH